METRLIATVDAFRAEVVRLRGGRRAGAVRYSRELMAFAVAHAHELLADGRSIHAAAKELGVAMMTLHSWLLRADADPKGRVRSLPTRTRLLLRPEPAQTLTVTTASGHVVSGLDLEQATALLRALSAADEHAPCASCRTATFEQARAAS